MALTLLVTAIITVFQLVTSVLAAYSFAFVRFPFKNTLFILLLASLLSFTGYFAVRAAWRWHLVRAWQRRKARR